MNSLPAEIILHVQKSADLFKTPVILFQDMQLLDKEVESYITERAGVFHHNEDLLITIQLENADAANEEKIAEAIHHHFSHCLARTKKLLRHTLNLGWRSLAIAFVFLLLMYSIANRLVPQLPEGGLTISIKEVFIILGWVALWRPAELLLYEWFPLRKTVRLYEKLSKVKIRVEK